MLRIASTAFAFCAALFLSIGVFRSMSAEAGYYGIAAAMVGAADGARGDAAYRGPLWHRVRVLTAATAIVAVTTAAIGWRLPRWLRLSRRVRTAAATAIAGYYGGYGYRRLRLWLSQRLLRAALLRRVLWLSALLQQLLLRQRLLRRLLQRRLRRLLLPQWLRLRQWLRYGNGYTTAGYYGNGNYDAGYGYSGGYGGCRTAYIPYGCTWYRARAADDVTRAA